MSSETLVIPKHAYEPHPDGCCKVCAYPRSDDVHNGVAPERVAAGEASSHTPLPWFAGDDHPSVCAMHDGESVQIATMDTAPFAVGEPEANAALIVRAVNSHEALVEACRLILAQDGEYSSHTESLYQSAISAAKTALALAEGGEK